MPPNRPLPRAITQKQLLGFWSQVDRSNISGCWEWIGNITEDGPYGYGNFGWGGHLRRSHRVAYFIYTGRDPGNLLVCHHCDNPKCVKFDHLFLGTQADNVHDCFRKGRKVSPRQTLGQIFPAPQEKGTPTLNFERVKFYL
mgnify:FL=1